MAKKKKRTAPTKAPEALTAEQVARRCDPGELGFSTTAEAEPVVGVVGQSRAMGALELAARMDSDGFNVYVMGESGNQRHEVVRNFLQQESRAKEQPPDWCYLNNFVDPQKPQGVTLPAGRGMGLKRNMTQLVDDLKASIPAAFDSENYRSRLAEIEDEFNARNQEVMEGLQAEAEKEGLGVLPTPHGFAIAPVREEKILPEEEFLKLPEAERERSQKAIANLSEKFRQYFENLPKWHKERRQQVKELDNNVTLLAVGSLIANLRNIYADCGSVIEYLDAVQQDVIDHAQDFIQGEAQPGGMPFGMQPDDGPHFHRYEVNVLVNNEATEGGPVVYESNPSYQNLVGRIEHASQFGTLTTDFTMIRPGALHTANGGYLIIDVDKILRQPFAWDGLKRAIQDGEIRIESLGQALSLISTRSLEPQPQPLNVKLVLIGDRLFYYLLCELDPDFQQFFKVAADFEDRIPRTAENVETYGRMLATIVREKSLRPFSAAGIARVIDQSSRSAGDTQKLSAKTRTVMDLMSEANHWAGQRDSELADAEDVEKAIEQRRFRLGRVRSNIHEAIQRELIHVRTDGALVGQVNGLSVLMLGDFMFGQPSRITATTRIGMGEVVDIEREVKLGGKVHSKGVMILSAYLGSRYTMDIPLSLSASLVFEQSYGQVDGDSASVAELVALLSSIADVPVRQSLAVTGSVDQKGMVQAIGGANQKIEGFFDVCNARGLTGEQGVLIPADNVQHLMLRRDVADAIAEGRFSIYPLRHVDEAITLLTGIEAGERDGEGNFPDDSVNGQVEQVLLQLAVQRKTFGRMIKADQVEDESEDDNP